ncbi:ras-related protein Rab-34 [Pogonomyrmex barbatus]|uniref:Ras-related protein Rab-36 n=1 Tax=Pogonomyrmex barbatus TaxID=144034 RepID=A0A6I9WTT0_9HYME|nr:ras-related protein Rab-34 [Pogonomyrmex barbatus]
MKQYEASSDTITNWPPPFSSEITPYSENDFDDLIKCTCETKNLTLRISKVIVIGDIAVGKTSLINRFCHRLFDNNYKATIGVDFEVERYDILDVPFHLQIWDTAGQERFKCIAASYYRDANVIIVVFDLGNLISLAHCQQWLNEASRSNMSFYHIFLVGTKKDLLSHPVYEIIEKQAIETATRMRAEYWAVSSKTGNGVSELFTRIAALSFNAMALQEMQNSKFKPINIGSDTISK